MKHLLVWFCRDYLFNQLVLFCAFFLLLKNPSPYIFRVALSNNRILSLAHHKVTFRYRQSDTGSPRLCTLSVDAFMHRFLQHVLPKGFVKVRYYGFFSAAHRQRLTHLRTLLPRPPHPRPVVEDTTASHPTILRCPRCHQPLRLLHTLPRKRYRPP